MTNPGAAIVSPRRRSPDTQLCPANEALKTARKKGLRAGKTARGFKCAVKDYTRTGSHCIFDERVEMRSTENGAGH